MQWTVFLTKIELLKAFHVVILNSPDLSSKNWITIQICMHLIFHFQFLTEFWSKLPVDPGFGQGIPEKFSEIFCPCLEAELCEWSKQISAWVLKIPQSLGSCSILTVKYAFSQFSVSTKYIFLFKIFWSFGNASSCWKEKSEVILQMQFLCKL